MQGLKVSAISTVVPFGTIVIEALFKRDKPTYSLRNSQSRAKRSHLVIAGRFDILPRFKLRVCSANFAKTKNLLLHHLFKLDSLCNTLATKVLPKQTQHSKG